MMEITHHNDVAILTMAHGKANAFDLEFSNALTAALEDLVRSQAKAIVITARGNIFSAGVDLLRVTTGGAEYLVEFLPAVSRAFETAFTCPKPVVAAINGHAFAGGCIVACAADRRLMARGTGRIGMPEVLVGVSFPTVPLEIARYAIPSQHLSALVYSGDTLLPERRSSAALWTPWWMPTRSSTKPSARRRGCIARAVGLRANETAVARARGGADARGKSAG